MAEGRKYDRSLTAQLTCGNASFLDVARAFWAQFGKGSIVCCQAHGPGKFQVTFAKVDTLVKAMEQGVEVCGQRYRPVPLVEPARWITIRYAPFEMPRADVVAMLAPYGDVLSYEVDNTHHKEFPGLSNGNRWVRFRMRKLVPNYLSWGPYNGVMVTYAGMVMTCRRCGQPGHKMAACKELLCNLCGKKGHAMSDCPTSQPGPSTAPQAPAVPADPEQVASSVPPPTAGDVTDVPEVSDGEGELVIDLEREKEASSAVPEETTEGSATAPSYAEVCVSAPKDAVPVTERFTVGATAPLRPGSPETPSKSHKKRRTKGSTSRSRERNPRTGYQPASGSEDNMEL